jgi:hypothetical protein
LESRRDKLGLSDPTMPRRRVSALVPYETADRIEDLARGATVHLGRRVTIEDVWAVAFAIVADSLE